MQDQPSQPEAGGAAAAATLMDFGPANENNTTNQSFGPALVSTASLDSPARESSILNIATDNNNQKPFQGQDGDSRATLREAEEYADGLARELIDDGRGAAAASVVAAAPLYFEEDSLNASPQRIHESPSPQGKPMRRAVCLCVFVCESVRLATVPPHHPSTGLKLALWAT